jgi:hypothetical protein
MMATPPNLPDNSKKRASATPRSGWGGDAQPRRRGRAVARAQSRSHAGISAIEHTETAGHRETAKTAEMTESAETAIDPGRSRVRKIRAGRYASPAGRWTRSTESLRLRRSRSHDWASLACVFRQA